MDHIVHTEHLTMLSSHAFNCDGKNRGRLKRTIQNWWYICFKQFFCSCKTGKWKLYTIEGEQWEEGLVCIFQNKVGVEQNQKTLAFTHTVP